jgi:hypothetical protein
MAVDFSYAAMMQGQAQSLQQAIDLLSGGGRITIMHCATAAGEMPGIEVMVNTADVVLPPEIIAAITDAMAVQLDDLTSRVKAELHSLQEKA